MLEIAADDFELYRFLVIRAAARGPDLHMSGAWPRKNAVSIPANPRRPISSAGNSCPVSARFGATRNRRRRGGV